MTHTPSILEIALPVLMGMALSASALYVWLWIRRRRDALAPWALAWSVSTLLVLVGRYVQIAATDPAGALFGGRIAWSGAILLLPIVMGLGHGVVGRPVTRRGLLVALPVTALLMALLLWTELIVAARTSPVASPLHLHPLHYQTMPGPLLPALLLGIAAAFVYFWRVALARSAGLAAEERRVLRAAIVVYVAFAVTGILDHAGLIRTERLFEVAFLAPTAGFTYVLVRRRHRLHTSIEGSATSREKRLTTLITLTQSLTATLSLDQVLNRVVAHAVELFDSSVSRIWLVEEGGDTIALRAHAGHRTEVQGVTRMKVGAGIAGRVVATRAPIVVEDLAEHEERLNGERHSAERLSGVYAVPLMLGDRAIGTLGVGVRERHAFTPEEVRVLQALADHAAIAVENARLYAEVGERLRRLETLTRLNRLVSSSLDTGTVLREIARAATELMNIPIASFWTVDESARTITLVAFSDLASESDFPYHTMSFGNHALGWVAERRCAVHVPDVFAPGSGIRAVDWWRQHGVSSFYGVPILHEGTLLAVLALDGREPFRIDPDAEQQIAAFTAQVALAMKNATAYEAEARARRDAEMALEQVKELQGMLPICAWCKKVRNDCNYWESIETYLAQRSLATFSHGICPDCRRDFIVPELVRWKREAPSSS